MNVDNVAWFYVSGGKNISILPYPGSNRNTIELFLNGSVYGAVLHQRKLMPFHGSSFYSNGEGMMICGNAGSGKSSVTASFCLKGAEFIADDITPVLFAGRIPTIQAVSDRIKLCGDTLDQLNRKIEGLDKIDYEPEKYFFRLESNIGKSFHLDHIFILEQSDTDRVLFQKLSGASKFAALRNEIYRKEYLQGMPDNETDYFEKLINICQTVKATKVMRPARITLEELHKELADYTHI
jgi:hypothetical protein